MAGSGDTTWCGPHITWGDMVHVHGRRGLVGMAIEAGGLGAEGDDRRYRGPRRVGWVNISCGIMAFAAIVQVSQQDIGPVTGMMAVGAGLAIGLAKVGCWIGIHRMVDDAAGIAVVVIREVTGVAVDTFAAAGESRADFGTVGRRMTGRAA